MLQITHHITSEEIINIKCSPICIKWLDTDNLYNPGICQRENIKLNIAIAIKFKVSISVNIILLKCQV